MLNEWSWFAELTPEQQKQFLETQAKMLPYWLIGALIFIGLLWSLS